MYIQNSSPSSSIHSAHTNSAVNTNPTAATPSNRWARLGGNDIETGNSVEMTNLHREATARNTPANTNPPIADNTPQPQGTQNRRAIAIQACVYSGILAGSASSIFGAYSVFNTANPNNLTGFIGASVGFVLVASSVATSCCLNPLTPPATQTVRENNNTV
jgi:hypothetical protein